MNQAKDTKAVIENVNQCTCSEHKKFVRDMSSAGITVFHYKGRMFWSGFAAIGNLQQILKNTTVDCLWETSADDYIVYPKAYSEEAEQELIDNFDIKAIALLMATNNNEFQEIAMNALFALNILRSAEDMEDIDYQS